MKKSMLILAAMAAMLVTSCDPQPKPDPDPVAGGKFKFEVTEITPSSAVAKVTPKDTVNWYYYDLETSAEVAEYGGINAYVDSLMAYFENEFDMYKTAYANYGIYSYADLLMYYSVKGEDEYEFTSLIADTKYTVFAYHIDSVSLSVSNIESYEFSTLPVQKSSNTFAIDYADNTITITPSNNDPYYWSVVESINLVQNEALGGTLEDWIMDDIDYWKVTGYLDNMLCTGVDKATYDNLTNGCDYTIYVVGWDGGFTTDVFTKEFTYFADHNAAKMDAPGRRAPGRRAPGQKAPSCYRAQTMHQSIR